jgi:FADH2 O2-dependent halogenase
MLYFAAASFSEACRRLGHPERAGRFLCGSHPTFGPAFERCCHRVCSRPRLSGEERGRLLGDIAQAIAPIDVAGLLDPSRKSWYPVDANDLRLSARRLGATPDEIEDLLRRSWG